MAGSNGTLDFRSLTAHIASNVGDYDAEKQRPVKGPYFKREPTDEVDPATVLTRLEDIDASWVENFVRAGIIGYKIRGSGRTAYMKNTREAVSFQNSDGEYMTGADLMQDRDNTTDLAILEARTKLPYLLKRIHFKSKQLGVSLISMYGVFLKINGNKGTPPRDMLRGHKIYRMDARGNVTTPYPETANQNPGFGENFHYIKGEHPDEFYHDLLEFREVLDTLGIRLWEEDPREFDEAFISGLVVKYVKSNAEFLWHGRKRDASVLQALTSVSVSDWAPSTTYTDYSRVLSFVSTFTESGQRALYEYMKPDAKSISMLDYFLTVYQRVTGDPNLTTDGRLAFKVADMLTYSGFYCLPDDSAPYMFNVSAIHTNPGAKALVHASGHVVLVTRTNQIQCLTVQEAALAFGRVLSTSGLGGKVEWTHLGM